MLADPQILDPYSFMMTDKYSAQLKREMGDQYMRRAFETLLDDIDPDAIIFMGDLFDGGREWATGSTESPFKKLRKYRESYWKDEFIRFGNIFFEPLKKARPGQSPRLGGRRKVLAGLPGNHDIGIGLGVNGPVLDRFVAHFGDSNRVDVLANHTFVSVDTASLSAVESHYRKRLGHIYNTPLQFLENVNSTINSAVERELAWMYNPVGERHKFPFGVHNLSSAPAQIKQDKAIVASNVKLPTVLLSHVPLYRDPEVACGPLREKVSHIEPGFNYQNSIMVRGGYQYQNVLTHGLSRMVTQKIGDVKYAFSGDDHDYCEVLHDRYQSATGKIQEVTIKSFSMNMGVRRPGFMMLSIWNPLDEIDGKLQANQDTVLKDTLQVHLCHMPDQISTYLSYAFLGVVTVIAIGVKAFRDVRKSPNINFYYGKPTAVSKDGRYNAVSEEAFFTGGDSNSDGDLDDLESGLLSDTVPFGESYSGSRPTSHGLLSPRRTGPGTPSDLSQRVVSGGIMPPNLQSRLAEPRRNVSIGSTNKLLGRGEDLPDPGIWWVRFRCGVMQVVFVAIPFYILLVYRW